MRQVCDRAITTTFPLMTPKFATPRSVRVRDWLLNIRRSGGEPGLPLRRAFLMSPEKTSLSGGAMLLRKAKNEIWSEQWEVTKRTSMSGFSLGLNDRAQRPVVFFSALSFFLTALSFFQRPVIFREPFGFFGLSSALFWAWSCRKPLIKAKGGAIFVHHVVIRVGHRRHLGFTMNISLCKLVRPVVFQDQLEHWMSVLDFLKDWRWPLRVWGSECYRRSRYHICCPSVHRARVRSGATWANRHYGQRRVGGGARSSHVIPFAIVVRRPGKHSKRIWSTPTNGAKVRSVTTFCVKLSIMSYTQKTVAYTKNIWSQCAGLRSPSDWADPGFLPRTNLG